MCAHIIHVLSRCVYIDTLIYLVPDIYRCYFFITFDILFVAKSIRVNNGQ